MSAFGFADDRPLQFYRRFFFPSLCLLFGLSFIRPNTTARQSSQWSLLFSGGWHRRQHHHHLSLCLLSLWPQERPLLHPQNNVILTSSPLLLSFSSYFPFSWNSLGPLSVCLHCVHPVCRHITTQIQCLPIRPSIRLAMNRYVKLSQLGDGTYGSVFLGQKIDSGEKVAIKK